MLKRLILPLCFLSFLLAGCGSAPPELTEDHFDQYEIQLPGCEKEYRFLFLTDSHIVIPDRGAEEQIRTYSDERLASFTAEDGNEIPSSDYFTAMLELADDQKLDGLFLGGDIIDSPAPSNVDFLKKSLDALAIPYLYTLGNHDWTYPWDYMTEEGKSAYLPLFLPFMQENTCIHTQEYDDFTVVAIDNSDNQFPPEALEPYRQILAKGKPVILLIHVPLFTDSLLTQAREVWSGGVVLGAGNYGGIYPDETSAELIELTCAADSPVFLILAGHVHFKEASNVPGEKEIPQIVGEAGYLGKGTLIHITGTPKEVK